MATGEIHGNSVTGRAVSCHVVVEVPLRSSREGNPLGEEGDEGSLCLPVEGEEEGIKAGEEDQLHPFKVEEVEDQVMDLSILSTPSPLKGTRRPPRCLVVAAQPVVQVEERRTVMAEIMLLVIGGKKRE